MRILNVTALMLGASFGFAVAPALAQNTPPLDCRAD